MANSIDSLIEKFALANAFQYGGKAQLGSVIGKLISEDHKIKSKLKELAPKIAKVVSEINKLSIKQQEEKLLKIYPEFFEKKTKTEEERELPELQNAKTGKVVMRLAPFPSGALHIGNAKTYGLNALYAEKYKGKLIFVMDDTIGSEAKAITPESYDLIPEGFKWLGIKWNGPIVYKSDRLEIYYKYAKEIIQKDFAYVCECSADVLRDNRAKGIVCKHRKQSVKENLELWEKMLAGKYKEGTAILRLKTDMKNPNPAFRDRVLFRISERKHPKVGNKYKVWPMLEFSWAIDDHLLGITHVFRGKELMMESEMCKFIWKIFKWPSPVLTHTGLMQIEGVKLSKSKAQQEVKSGKYSGWDDPRTWSLQSLRRRGFQPHAVMDFIRSIGPNLTDITVPIETLYAFNRKLIDPIAHRYSFVPIPVKIDIQNAPKIKEIEVKLHPENDKEMKKVKIGKSIFIPHEDLQKFGGMEVRLMHLYNLILNKKAKFTSEENKNIQKLQWVSDDNIKTSVLMPDGEIVEGLAESNTEKLKVGDIIQFERFGFVRLDKKEKGKLLFVYAHN